MTSTEQDAGIEHHPAPHNNVYVYLISIIAAVGGFLLTYDIIIMSGAIIFLKKQFDLTPPQVGFAMTSAILACFISPSIGGWLADRVGRKRTLIAAAATFALSAIGTAYPTNITEFNAFRILGGFGVGAACIVSPMYIAEIAPAYIRGRLVFITQVSNVVGALISYVVTYTLSFSGNWRWMFGSTAIPAIVFLIGLAFVPESPRWLALKGRIDEALKGLRRISSEEDAQAELRAIRETSSPVKARVGDLFKPGIRIALLIAVGLAILQQFDGVTVLLFYAPTIMQEAGFPQASKAIFISLLIGGWNLICTIVAFWLVDWAGRRPLLLYGSIGMALGLIIMGVFFQFHVTGLAVPLTMMLAVAAYSMTLAPVMWLIMAEIFPNQTRGMGMAVASTALWIADFGANFSFPIMTGSFEHHFGSAAGAFWVFAVICLFTFFFCWRLVPETKGKTLEEIASWWEPRASAVVKELT